ncbi:MAG TPA: VWA domain-containing protein, partial [Candidatus Dormibacteraeota bacterium]|nr:VWA domain-containing protein [Candidatus Dormibacteraeota bacterium]
LEAAIAAGARRFQPGLLAEAHRQILYVDEVNLLDDHLVDVLLDAAAMGVNVVEREGISAVHPSQFVLVGTMNPEEGELRPQLLDRFGLCVDVTGLRSVADRVAVMERDAERGGGAGAGYAAADADLARAILRARALLPQVAVPPAMLRLAAALCADQGVAGHRADIILARTARTLRALRAAGLDPDPSGPAAAAGLAVDPGDIVASAELVLLHRRRPADAGGPASPDLQGAADRLQEAEAEAGSAPPDPTASPRAEQSDAPGGEPQAQAGGEADGVGHQAPGDATTPAADGAGEGEDLLLEAPFAVRRLELPRDRRTRRTTGRRSPAPAGDRRGRYVRATEVERITDLALDATLRAAAPHQRRRRAAAAEAGRAPGPHLRLERQDLRQKVRERKQGNLIVFAVDASASMDAEQRMAATKGAILSLLRDAYVRRDRVAVVVFSGRTARVVLRPTGSVDLAERRLARLTVGGTTPLTHGLLAALQLIRTERRRDATVLPLLVLISDGRGNISLFGEEPLLEAQRAAAEIQRERIRALVIDSAHNHRPVAMAPGRQGSVFAGYSFNACRDLADRLAAQYFGLYDLSQESILGSVAQALHG